MKPVICRTTNRRVMLTEDYLRLTVLTFEPVLGRTVTMEEAREIAENTLAWLEWLVDEDESLSAQKAS